MTIFSYIAQLLHIQQFPHSSSPIFQFFSFTNVEQLPDRAEDDDDYLKIQMYKAITITIRRKIIIGQNYNWLQKLHRVDHADATITAQHLIDPDYTWPLLLGQCRDVVALYAILSTQQPFCTSS